MDNSLSLLHAEGRPLIEERLLQTRAQLLWLDASRRDCPGGWQNTATFLMRMGKGSCSFLGADHSCSDLLIMLYGHDVVHLKFVTDSWLGLCVSRSLNVSILVALAFSYGLPVMVQWHLCSLRA